MTGDPEVVACPLPALPESVEGWIAAATPDGQGITLHRKAGTRHVQVASFPGFDVEPKEDLHGWVLQRVSAWVVEHGGTQWQLARKGGEKVAWVSELAQDEEVAIELESTDPLDMVKASWQLTFKSAQMMLNNLSVGPRYLEQLVGLQREALQALREAAKESETVTVAALEADANAKKLDKIMRVLEHLGPNSKEKTKPAGAMAAARKLLAALPDDDQDTVFGHRVGRALAFAEDWSGLQKSVEQLWAAHTAGELKISKEGLEAARKIVAELKGEKTS